MTEIAVSADHARQNWRDMLDVAYQHGAVVIERYNKPVAVVVNYDDWRSMQCQAPAASTGLFTTAEVEALMMAKRSVEAGGATIAHDDLVQLIMDRRAGNVAH